MRLGADKVALNTAVIENPKLIFEKLVTDTSKYILASFPKKGGLLAFQRKIRYNLRQCPLYLYTKRDVQILAEKLTINDYKIIDSSKKLRSYY